MSYTALLCCFVGITFLALPGFVAGQATSPSAKTSSSGTAFKPPLHFWKFDSVTSDNFSPDEGSANNKIAATLTQATLVPGKSGKAVDFPVTGTGTFQNPSQTSIDYPTNTGALVTIPYDMSELTDKGYTVSLWFRQGQRLRAGYSSLFDSGRRNGLEIRFNTTDEIILNAGQNWNFIKAAKSVPNDVTQWIHVAATYAAGKVEFYVNGSLVESKDGVAAPEFPKQITLGGVFENYQNNLHAFTEGFVGDEDDLLIFDYQLTADQIKTLSLGTPDFKPDASSGLH